MAGRLMTWSAVVVSVAWIGAAAWVQFENRTPPELAELRQQQYEQKLKDCRGQFSKRYDCKSAVIREQNQKTLNVWATRLGVTLGPPIFLTLIVSIVGKRLEKRRERDRNVRLRKRREAEAKAERERVLEAGRRQVEAARRQAGQTPPDSDEKPTG